jgi:hypothetical protein
MGSSQTALVGTIGVTILNSDGTVHTARATANIYEIGGGCYGKDCTFDDNFKGSIKWDTGGGTPVYAIESYYVAGQVDKIYDEMDSGFLSFFFYFIMLSNYMYDLWLIQGLDTANPMTVTPTSRVAETIQQAISGDGTASSTITRTA